MSSVKRKKIRTLPLKVKRHIPGLKPEIVKHDLMATTMEHYQDFDDVEPETGMVNVANRKGEVVSVKVQVDDENEQIDSTAESSKYSNRKEKDFVAWSEIIRESLTISCEIEGHLMSSGVCCTCKKNVGDVRCLDCSMESTYCESCARKMHQQWNFWTHSLEIKKVCIVNACVYF